MKLNFYISKEELTERIKTEPPFCFYYIDVKNDGNNFTDYTGTLFWKINDKLYKHGIVVGGQLVFVQNYEFCSKLKIGINEINLNEYKWK